MKRLLLASAAAIALSAPALAADLGARMPVKAPAYVAAYNWTGFYLGVNLGGGWGTFDETVTSPFGSVATSERMSGVIGGGQVGYNWQTGNLLFGLEADLQGSGEQGSITGTGGIITVTTTDRLRWFGTGRGRVGYAADRWLFYVTGGGAWQNTSRDVTVTVAGIGGGTATASDSGTRFGWTLGGGVETALWANWTGGVEYLYIDTGNQTITNAVATTSLRERNNIVRAKLNYRF
jgi:outer membrane immunogenic protein